MQINPEIIVRCLKNDRIAQKELFCHFVPYVKNLINRYIYDKSFIDDCAQETFVRTFKNMNQFVKERGEFHSWIAKIAINCTLEFNRKNGNNNKDLSEHSLFTETSNPGNEKLFENDILVLLQLLSFECRIVFQLNCIEGFTHDEIAKLLCIDAATSRQRLSRARKKLQELLKNNYLVK